MKTVRTVSGKSERCPKFPVRVQKRTWNMPVIDSFWPYGGTMRVVTFLWTTLS